VLSYAQFWCKNTSLEQLLPVFTLCKSPVQTPSPLPALLYSSLLLLLFINLLCVASGEFVHWKSEMKFRYSLTHTGTYSQPDRPRAESSASAANPPRFSQPRSADCLLFFLVVLLLIIIYQSPLTITIISWERANPSQPHPATQRNDAVSTSLMNAASVCALSACGALDDAGGFELRVFLKETGCREETWLPRIKGDGDSLGTTLRNNMSGCSPGCICLQRSGAMKGLSKELVPLVWFCVDNASTFRAWL